MINKYENFQRLENCFKQHYAAQPRTLQTGHPHSSATFRSRAAGRKPHSADVWMMRREKCFQPPSSLKYNLITQTFLWKLTGWQSRISSSILGITGHFLIQKRTFNNTHCKLSLMCTITLDEFIKPIWHLAQFPFLLYVQDFSSAINILSVVKRITVRYNGKSQGFKYPKWRCNVANCVKCEADVRMC